MSQARSANAAQCVDLPYFQKKESVEGLTLEQHENYPLLKARLKTFRHCYGQPPDINGIVRVVMPKGKTTDYFFDPIKIIGTFKVEATVLDGYCVDIYQLQVESLEAIR